MKSIMRFIAAGLTGIFLLLGHAGFAQSGCGNISSGSLSFEAGSCAVLPAAEDRLRRLADEMRAEPACRVVVMGNAGGNKPSQQLSWARVQAVIEQMSESNNIDRNRFVFVYEGQAGIDNVDFRATSPDDDGPSSLPPPFPGAKSCR